MNPLRILQWVGIVAALGGALYLVFAHMHYLSNVSVLGGILLAEIIIACVWKYDQRFFILLIIAFAWAGMDLPLESSWTMGRWVILAVGAAFGVIIWLRTPRGRFGTVHLIAFFCISAAFVSATVSPFTQMALLKALSLLLLFAYCASGARLAVLGREDLFFRALLLGSEVTVYGTAICYLVLGQMIWSNPNSLGAVMSVALFPILLWGWLTSEGRTLRIRRLAALLLCVYLVYFSMARAAMVTVSVVILVFCLCLRQYKLLVRVAALGLLLVAVAGILAPEGLRMRASDLEDTILYKGHKEGGIMQSRRTPWDISIASIKAHPWFGTGYGTSPTGESAGLSADTYSSRAEAAREHGNSYISITEWVGLLGVLPFIGLIAVTSGNIWRVCTWMKRTANPRHYSIPLAMVVLAGLVHANFEDWLFAVGYYLCGFFWVFAFVLADLAPDPSSAPAPKSVPYASHPSPTDFGAVVSTR